MHYLLALSRRIDRLSGVVGGAMSWAVLAMVLLSAANAFARKLFNIGSNASLEAQLYLFGAVFLLNGANTLLRDEHIRIDILFTRLPPRARWMIDIGGILLFLLPMAGLVVAYALPVLLRTFHGNEASSNTGGLLLWPAWALVVAGFLLLIAQAGSELIKRIARLRGVELPEPAREIFQT